MRKHLVPCIRPAVPAWRDSFGNTQGQDRPQATFDAAFAPPTSEAGSQIVDGILRETTVTKPTLYEVTGQPDVRSGDPITVNGDPGWEADGDPAAFVNPFTGRTAPLVIELRRSV
jgi:hypothetical protein